MARSRSRRQPIGQLVPLLALTAAACGSQPPATLSVHQIRIVGGAAGFPFTTAIAERLMEREPDIPAPLVQAGGDTAGIARFCGGGDARHPDLALVTRAMTPDEARRCAAHGIVRVEAIPIGWSATIVAATPPPVVPALTSEALHIAITGPARTWSQAAPGLPRVPITIHGTVEAAGTLAPRRDGGWHGHGADAALAADAAVANPQSIALLPYAAWWRRREALAATPLDGVMPDPATIASGRYHLRARLVLLTKPGAARTVPGIAALLRLFAASLEPGGAFAASGLVPLAIGARAASRCAFARAAGDRRPPNCNN